MRAMNRPAGGVISPSARSYQQVVTKLLRHSAFPQLRKIIDKTLPADISPVLPLLLDEDRRRILGEAIEELREMTQLIDELVQLLEVLGHHLRAGRSNRAAGRQRVAIVTARRPLELHPDEECSLSRGRKLDQFS